MNRISPPAITTNNGNDRWGQLGRDLAHEIKQYVKRPLTDELAALRSYVADLESRVSKLEADLEQRTYKGVWQDGGVYEQHNEVTLGGSLWKCLQRTTSRPGTDPQAWQLAVKRGRGE